jgi:alpha-glucosidase
MTIHLYRQGSPFETEAVVELSKEVKEGLKPLSELKSFKVAAVNEKDSEKITEEGVILSYNFKSEDMVIGLGETMKGLNKRGSELISFCADEPEHIPSKKSLYGAHNFFIIVGESIKGFFIDFPGEIVFDIGFQDKDIFNIHIKGSDLDVYEIEGDSIKEVVHGFLSMIGASYVPPKWGFGYQQCRWSYERADDIRRIAKNMRESGIPCDTIYLDIDYMERFKDFTTCDDKFPHFESFVKEMKDQNFRLIPIIDAGVKIEEGYDVYEEGVKEDYFCVDTEGKPFVAAVWPGLVHFPDFLKDDAREWFGNKYKVLTDAGIEGFWNDMNEPAIFYTPERLQAFYDHVESSKEKPLDIYSFFDLKGQALDLSNNMVDYQSFYHRVDGDLIRHDKVHNLYGYNMTRSAAQGLEEIDPHKRFLLFSRASYIGMHRYGGIWMGDNDSWWSHIELAMKMLPAINMCGFMYTGCDTGGFQSDASSELMIRWNQFSLFTPLFRNHAALNTRDQEPFAFDNETKETLKSMIELRYALVPYLYSTYMQAVKNRLPYSMNLMMDYEDSRVREIEDQVLIGDNLMIAPIYEQNKTGRMVYLPEDMLLWKSSGTEVKDLSLIKSGDQYVPISLAEVPLFIRPDKGIILGGIAETVEAIDPSEMTFVGFQCDSIEVTYYDDDGLTTDYQNETGIETTVSVVSKEDSLVASVGFHEKSGLMKMTIIVMTAEGARYEGVATREASSVRLEKVS